MSLEKFQSLRRQFDQFLYESYEVWKTEDDVWCRFRYRIQGRDQLVVFEHMVRFACHRFPAVSPEEPVFQHAVFLLGLAESISYWKLICPKVFVIMPGYLSEEELLFWNKLFLKGLGEFYWLNGLYGQVAEEEIVRFDIHSNAPKGFCGVVPTKGFLVPVGGGKDSVVTLELLRTMESATEEMDCFLLSARKAAYDTSEIAGFDKGHQAEAFRTFDPQLFKMNEAGYLNGHVPYSAILGFSAVVAALLYGRRYIVLSNEGSANEPTVPGTWVNHQYSKSLEFETDFSTYLRRWLTPSIHYFSLLRPWSEARIAEAFAGMPAYHAAFRSCNRGSKENVWCCECSKCLFVFLLIAAHAGVEKTGKMFGENLLEKASLRSILDELAGFSPIKPFECVGTVGETRWSLERLLERADLPANAWSWALVSHYIEMRGSFPLPSFRALEPELALRIPPGFRHLLLGRESQTASEILRLQLEPHRIGILGFGMEGRSTFRFLRTLFPDKHLMVADQFESGLESLSVEREAGSVTAVWGKAYVQALAACSLVIKSPGIPWKDCDDVLQPGQVTSQTDLFLSVLGSRTVGITGTKGKSTTAHLLHAAVKACGADVVMVGNMGSPALDALCTDRPGRLYVYELSSHMLEILRHAPHGAIYLNLYEDHLDHYRTYVDYASAKDNLLRLQTGSGFAIAGENVWTRTIGLGNARHYRVMVDSDGTLRLPRLQRVESLEGLPPVLEGQTGHVELMEFDKREGNGSQPESLEILESAFSKRVLRGVHNLRNMQTAMLAACLWGLELESPAVREAAIGAMCAFSGLPHRLERVALSGGRAFFNDSISTIPESCMQAVKALGDVDVLLFGGMDRGIDYTELLRFFQSGQVPHLVALPDTGHMLVHRLQQEGGLPSSVQVYLAADMQEAVKIALEMTRPGHSCLLSPAAASYGKYRNFEERGDHFTGLVRSGLGKSLLS